MAKFVPLAPYLNVQEVDDIEKAWQSVAEKLDMKVKDLKEKIIRTVQLHIH